MSKLTRSLWPCIASALLLLAPDPAPAQTAGPIQLQGYGLKIYRVESGLYPYVHVYFRTFDQSQDPLVNLNALNIGLMVKGRSYDPRKAQYAIQPLRQRSEAVRTVIVLDASKSMAGKPFEDALRAAARFVDSKRTQDQVAVIAVRDTKEGYQPVSDWSRDSGELGRRLADVRADGEKTRLYDAIAAAMALSASAGAASGSVGSHDYPASTAIVVFSDGKDEGSALSREELNARISSLEIPVPIFSVAYSRLAGDNFKNLESLSKNSFGTYFEVGEATDRMQQVVERIQSTLLGDYVVTFRSYIPVDGERHAFKLGVEFPTGSGRYTYQSGHFEALEPPPVKPVVDQIAELSKRLVPLEDQDPYLPGVGARPAEH